jgi:hypothetical protein
MADRFAQFEHFLPPVAMPQGDRPLARLTLANDGDERDATLARVDDLARQRVSAVVERHAQAGVEQRLFQPAGVGCGLLVDRGDQYLLRRQPCR